MSGRIDSREYAPGETPRSNRRGHRLDRRDYRNRTRANFVPTDHRDLSHHRPKPIRRCGFDVDPERSVDGFNGDGSKPYLDELPGTYGAQLEIFGWLERLVSKAGRDGALSALEYYESIEWLSAGSRASLKNFLNGIETTETVDEALCIADHRESLAYVVRIAGRLRR